MLYLVRRGLGAAPRARSGRGGDPGVSIVGYVREHRWVLSLLTGVFSTSAALEVVRTLAPALVVVELHAAESTAGILIAAQSVGSAVGLALFVPLNRSGLARRMAAAGIVMQAAGLLGATFATGVPVAAVAVAFIGLGFSLCFPVLTGDLQAQVSDAVRGRVMSLHTISHLGNRPFTALAVGALATVVSAHWAVLSGLILAPLGLFMIRQAWSRMAAETGGAEAGAGGAGRVSAGSPSAGA